MKKYKSTKTGLSKANEPAVAYAKAIEVSVYSLLDVEASRVTEPLSRVSTFRKGFRKKSFDKLKEVTGLDYQTLALALSVSTKTLQRKQVFDVVQSEKMYELAELYAMGISYFGEEGFKRWMDRPLFSLGNIRPLELIDVSQGVDLLKTEIMRVQHGIAV
jgi:putative toxin-antitoxin system antitoxin component (TIGR02293 family)